ncbi:hypothetical protein [Bradyrhizobium sp. Cp5.3]|uniref:hypothetical protein n=1 Tax=Bradyrhizobium sp. Cp5.3 TaxID=443598 RepID=UPI00041E1B0F|nr:hypothetical protein [Bradyrhizobium sp. Cp5.3]
MIKVLMERDMPPNFDPRDEVQASNPDGLRGKDFGLLRCARNDGARCVAAVYSLAPSGAA